MDIAFHPAGRPEIPQLVQFMREYYAFDHLPFDEDRARGALEALVGDETLGRVWVIRAGGAAIGYVVLTLGYSLEYGGRDAFIDELYVREAYRGQGVGSRTLSFVAEVCRALGVAPSTSKSNGRTAARTACIARPGSLIMTAT
jgi:GNAT superfamily N-acetyltransferase